MSKRLTDTQKWSDPWFCNLSMKDKAFWIYLLDTCNHAGIWQVNWPLVQFHIKGFTYSHQTYEGRILEVTPLKWFIPKFIAFQYGTLNPANRVHKAVIEVLEKEGAWQGLGSPMAGAKDKDKVKDKEMEKDMEKVKDKVKDVDVVRHLEFVLLKPDEFKKLQEKLGPLVGEYLERLNGWLGQTGAHAKYKSHYHTILNWYRKDVAGGKHGPNDSKSAYHISPPQERKGSFGLTPSELRARVDEAGRQELPARFRDHAVVAPGRREGPDLASGDSKPVGTGNGES